MDIRKDNLKKKGETSEALIYLDRSNHEIWEYRTALDTYEKESLEVEVSRVRNLKSQTILKPLQLINKDGKSYLVFERKLKKTLKDLLKEKGKIQQKKAIRIILDILEGIGEAHDKGLLHGNLNPQNIHIEGKRIKVSGWSSFRIKKGPIIDGFTDFNEILYISPEQTGRLDVHPDKRCDLYSIGVMIYELLTGENPFQEKDSIGIIHAHIAKRPESPRTKDKSISEMVSNITLKLIEKNPDDRYQEAESLKHDLEKCYGLMDGKGDIKRFDIDTFRTGSLNMTERFYGRKQELKRFEETIEKSKTPSFILLSGYSGVGKTRFIKEIQKNIIGKNYIFGSGKQDQLKKGFSNGSLMESLRNLVKSRMLEGQDSIERLKKDIVDEVGRNSRIITDLIPDLRGIVGKTQPIARLNSLESYNRFKSALKKFIKVLAKDSTLILFLDDLQWVDDQTTNLIRDIVHESDLKLIVVGIFRYNEVDETHSLSIMINELKKDIRIERVRLKPLLEADIQKLIMDTLSLNEKRAKELAGLVYEKTKGNPFFSKQLLISLKNQGILKFHPRIKGWVWEEKAIRSLKPDYDFQEFFKEADKKLKEGDKKIIGIASCIGQKFDPKLVKDITGMEYRDVLMKLLQLTDEGLLIKDKENFIFSHDHFQKMAYGFMDKRQRMSTHYRIAQILQGRKGYDLFRVVDNMNLARGLFNDLSLIRKNVRLNLQAGLKAKDNGSYELAAHYFKQGLKSEKEIEDNHVKFNLYKGLGESRYLNLKFDESESLFQKALEQTTDPLDISEIGSLKLKLYMAKGDFKRAFEEANRALEVLGERVPRSKIGAISSMLILLIKTKRMGKDAKSILSLPVTSDPVLVQKLKILTDYLPLSFYQAPHLIPWIILKMVYQSMRYGNSIGSSFAYGIYASLLVLMFKDTSHAYDYGISSLKINEKLSDTSNLTKTIYASVFFSKHLKEDMGVIIESLRKGYVSGMETGDIINASLCFFQSVHLSLDSGKNLEDVYDDFMAYSDVFRRVYPGHFYSFTGLVQYAACLTGKTGNHLTFDSESFKEKEYLKIISQDVASKGQYRLMKLSLFALFGSREGMIEEIEFLRKNINVLSSTPLRPKCLFFLGMGYFILASGEKRAMAKKHAKNLEKMVKEHKLFADSCPANYSARQALLEGLMHELKGNLLESESKYLQSADLAGKYMFMNTQAMAYERLLRLSLKKENNVIIGCYLSLTLDAYRKWGAKTKAKALEEEFRRINEGAKSIQTTMPEDAGTGYLDTLAVLKSSQEISEQITTDALVTKLIELTMKSLGAQTAFFIKNYGPDIEVKAKGTLLNGNISISLDKEEIKDYPSNIVNYVIKTGETLIVEDASTDVLFKKDIWVAKNGTRSLICMPIRRQNQPIGVIYLENNLLRGAFRKSSIQLLSILSSQAAISIDNTELLEEEVRNRKELKEFNAVLEKKVKERTKEIARINTILESANEELKSLDKKKDEFISLTAHELKTPLISIRGFAQLLMNRKLNVSERKRKHYLELINDNTETLYDLIMDIVDSSRLRTGNLKLNIEELDIKQIFDDIKENMGVIFKENGIEGRFSIEKGLPPILVDKERIMQVLRNLMINASHFTHKGGTISLDIYMKGRFIQFNVADTGEGIPKEKQKYIFSKFFQADTSMTRKIKGSGLGLSVSKGIIELMGGKIWFRSQEGKGTTFSFTIPIIRR